MNILGLIEPLKQAQWLKLTGSVEQWPALVQVQGSQLASRWM